MPGPTRGSPRGPLADELWFCSTRSPRPCTSRSSSCWWRSFTVSRASPSASTGAIGRRLSGSITLRSSKAWTSSSRTTAVALRSAPAAGGPAPRVLGLAQPLRRPTAQPRRAQLGTQDLRREEVVLHEIAETSADAILPLGDNGGVRDRQVERVPEQRGNGEPVRHTTHEPRFRGRAHVAEPGVRSLESPGDHEDHAHEHQQPGRPPFHAGELQPFGLRVEDLGDRREVVHRLKATWDRAAAPADRDQSLTGHGLGTGPDGPGRRRV